MALGRLVEKVAGMETPLWHFSGCSWVPHQRWRVPLPRLPISFVTSGNRLFHLTQMHLDGLASDVVKHLRREVIVVAASFYRGEIEGPKSGSDSSLGSPARVEELESDDAESGSPPREEQVDNH